MSKPELNNSVIKSHFYKRYLNISRDSMKTIRAIYYRRRRNLESIRQNNAIIFVVQKKISEAKKQLQMLKDQNPIKHENLNLDI